MTQVGKILTYGSLGLLFLIFAGVAMMLAPKKEPKVTIGRIEFTVDIANEPAEWRRGLVGHPPLMAGEGMLFIFPSASNHTFWMKDMEFSIDIIWIANNKVIGYVDNAVPDRGEILYKSPGKVDKVLEIAAGERKRLEITIGAPVTVE